MIIEETKSKLFCGDLPRQWVNKKGKRFYILRRFEIPMHLSSVYNSLLNHSGYIFINSYLQ